MATSRHRGRGRARRGVILILVLGVLGLMAVIGVTFATFTGQARISGRNFAQSKLQSQGDELMDFALSQLICDTSDVRSAIRGHSLARDMYGNDGARNGFLASRSDGVPQAPGNNSSFYVTRVQKDTVIPNAYILTTNISQGDPLFYSHDFKRWTVRVAYNTNPAAPPNKIVLSALSPAVTGVISQTFEVIDEDGFNPGVSDPRRLKVIILDSDRTARIAHPGYNTRTPAYLFELNLDTDLADDFQFVLDGRWLHAFNGPGKTDDAKYANFRFNQDSPSLVGMDEDYDACDLENWFLAMQSADGSVMIPSFHRPANVRYQPGTINDWDNTAATTADLVAKLSRILRPRNADGHDPTAFPDLIPSDIDGKIRYDVDNDGDGAFDSVWVDLGYPPRRNAQGVLYKPMFAFMVIGLNGRIPLNTAGNLAGRESTASGPGNRNASHASHLGNSVSEIDPQYALQNAGNSGFSQRDDAGRNVAQTQLQNILAGTRPQQDLKNPDTTGAVNGDANRVQMGTSDWMALPNGIADGSDFTDGTGVRRLTEPVPGRWGEAEAIPGGTYPDLSYDYLAATYNNEVRPGYSMSSRDTSAAGTLWDAADDNFNAFDVWPVPDSTVARVGEIHDEDLYDAAGALTFPIERMRRFITPMDVNGSGGVVQWRGGGGGGGKGADQWGRVAYQGYFRPPGLPGQVDPTTGAVSFPWTSGQNYPLGRVAQATVAAATAHNNNMLHGYESALFPNTMGRPQSSGGAPAYVDGTSPGALGLPTKLPSYNGAVNSGIDYTYNGDGPPDPVFNSRSDGLNEADEMNLYNVDTNLDAPYTHSDLEWLYRRHDVDGRSLTSRLARLAPVSFQNGQDDLARRRMFAIDAWEPNSFVWANDNPTGIFPDNHRFTANANASMANINGVTPALAQRDRKINLNMPLPVSNDPDEPVRRKWIGDAYLLMKTVLPPRAVDTPEELAQLGQYLVNLIDYRDTDCAVTRWTNPDVLLVPAQASGNTMTPKRPYLVSSTASVTQSVPLVQYGMEHNPIAINEVLAYSYARHLGGSPPTPTPTGQPTGRFFIELVNTLSLSKTAHNASAVDNAAVIDLSGYASSSTGAPLPNPYDGGCWDMVFTDDAVGSRPNPYTGQLDPGAVLYGLTPLGQDANAGRTPALADATLKGIRVDPLPRTNGGTTAVNWFGDGTRTRPLTVIGNAFPGTTAETSSESTPVNASAPFTTSGNAAFYTLNNAKYDPFNPIAGGLGFTLRGGILPNNIDGSVNLTAPTTIPLPALPTDSGQAKYYWVCLRRPANPMAPAGPDNPMIVVDSMRFPYIDCGGTVRTDSSGDPTDDANRDVVSSQGSNHIYSYQRLQPYRGGQSVPADPTVAGSGLDTRYGFTEQVAAPATSSGNLIRYGTNKKTSATPNYFPDVNTNPIYHTLGLPNDGTFGDPATAANMERWDLFTFLDRDFTSVFELAMVPGCAPGLFTKQFAEFAPSAANKAAFDAVAAAPPVTPALARPAVLPVGSSATIAGIGRSNVFSARRASTADPVEPHTFPYLVDRFFYTAAGNLGTSDTLNSSVGGYAADGWHRMFEFFEVPTQMTGAIGPVAQGTNFDWYRQDFKPGLMNLNLLIDEEAFFAVLGKQDLDSSTQLFTQQLLNPYQLPEPTDAYYGWSDIYRGGLWNGPLPKGYPPTPMIVQATNLDGSPAYVSCMSNRGSYALDPFTASDGYKMKAAFAQFLWLRHGGSGFLFGYGGGAVNQNYIVNPPTPYANAPVYGGTVPMPIPMERPFRSLSYPDVDFTAMRPAALPPSTFTDPQQQDTAAAAYVGDPGVRNRFLYPAYATSTVPASTATAPLYPPAIPTRRLFQIPDAYAPASSPSNASRYGDDFVNGTIPATTDAVTGAKNPSPGALPPIKISSTNYKRVNDATVNLMMPYDSNDASVAPGGSYPVVEFGHQGGAGATDSRQHPYFRGEIMQRALNLTTPRTHQFAVWITIGFFEVKREGDIAMIGSSYPTAAFDLLGPEIGASTGENTRYRSFFVVDRLKLTGFDPDSVGAFRPAVVYRRTIE